MSLAFLSGFEPLAFRLGGGRSILLSYRNAYEIFMGRIPKMCPQQVLLRGGRSILLSYRNPYEIHINTNLIKITTHLLCSRLHRLYIIIFINTGFVKVILKKVFPDNALITPGNTTGNAKESLCIFLFPSL